MEDTSVLSVVDLRSDTLSRPTQQMRDAMANAEVGDDVFGEDPTVNKLQCFAADMFGKEDALFVATGTMGNLTSVMCHCWERSSQVFLGSDSHIYQWEQGGISQIAGVGPCILENAIDGTFSLTELRAKFQTGSDPHKMRSSLIAIETPFNGRVVPLKFLKELRAVADDLKLPIHMDGARIMSAAVSLGVPAKEICQYADSVSICLSKGLGSPVGSVIVGSTDFINRARRIRKALGGGMRQVGILAAAGMLSLTVMAQRVKDDHNNAYNFAKSMLDISHGCVEVDLSTVETNMVIFTVKGNKVKMEDDETANEEFRRRMGMADSQSKTIVKMLPYMGKLRTVFYHNITENDVKLAIHKAKCIFDDWASK